MKKALLVLTVVLATGIASLNAQVTNGLVAKWSFNGNANDEVGTNNGTVSGARLTTDRFGNAKQAYKFDGVDDFIDLGTSSTIKPKVGSISLWVKMKAFSSSGTALFNPIIFTKSSSPNNNLLSGYHFTVFSSKQVAIFMDDVINGGVTTVQASGTLSTTSWTHYVISYDNDSLNLYINGQLKDKVYKGFANTFSTSSPVLLAKIEEGSLLGYFNGMIDDVRIYNRRLNQEEVASLFNEPDDNSHKKLKHQEKTREF